MDDEGIASFKSAHKDFKELLPEIRDPTAKYAIKALSTIVDTLQRTLVRAMKGDNIIMDLSHDIMTTTLDNLGLNRTKRIEAENAININQELIEGRKDLARSDMQRIYLHGIANNRLGTIRKILFALGINTMKLYNIAFVGKNLLEVLTSKAYIPHLKAKIKKMILLKITIWPNFDPLKPIRLGIDPDYTRAQAKNKYIQICKVNAETTKLKQVKEFYREIMDTLESESQQESNKRVLPKEVVLCYNDSTIDHRVLQFLWSRYIQVEDTCRKDD